MADSVAAATTASVCYAYVACHDDCAVKAHRVLWLCIRASMGGLGDMMI